MTRTRGLRIGTVNGVPIILTAGWLVVVGLMVYIFTPVVQARMGLSVGPALAVALTIPLMLAFSVLLHELAHGLTAQFFGIDVREYVITLSGGHTAFRGPIDTPGVSAAVAFAGPAVNLALGAIGWVGAVFTSGATSFFLFSLGITNGLLALFNLLPAAPLDGGKVAEAVIWKMTGNRLSGMRATGRLGQIIAVLTGVGFVGWQYATGRSDLFTVAIGLIVAMVIWRGASETLNVAKMRAGTESFQLAPYLIPAAVLDPHATVGQITRLPAIVTDMADPGAGAPAYGLINAGTYNSVPAEQRRATPVTALVTKATAHHVTTAHGSEAVTQIAYGLNGGAQIFVLDGAAAGIPAEPGQTWLIDIDRVLAELKRRGA